MHWYSIYTKPKHEDIVAKSLLNAGLEVFNPKLRQKKYLQCVYRYAISPLFPCYIFVKFEPKTTSHMIKYTRGVKRVVGGEMPWPVSDEIIDLIKSQEENGLISIKHPELRRGDSVIIKDGPLQGLSGVFENEISGEGRIILLLTAIEYQARVVIEKSFLMKTP